MKINIEDFIKYLQNDFSTKEKIFFEKKLEENSEFKNQFYEFSELYTSSKKNIEIDEKYFSTLLPISKKRLEKPKRISLLKLAWIVPILIVGMSLIFKNLFYDKMTSNYDFENLLDTFTENEVLTTDLFSNAFNSDNNYILNENLLSKYYEDDLKLDESVFEYLEKSLAVNNIDHNFIDELSDDEFNSVYAEISNNKNFIGAK